MAWNEKAAKKILKTTKREYDPKELAKIRKDSLDDIDKSAIAEGNAKRDIKQMAPERIVGKQDH